MKTAMLAVALLVAGLVALPARAADWNEIKLGNPDRMEVVLTVDAGGYIDNATDYEQKMFRANSMLDQLEARNVPVTTFVTKLMLDNYPLNIQRFIKNGYEFGNHTMSHPDFTAKTNGSYTYSETYLLDQVNTNETYLRAAYGGRPSRPWFRFPYGARDQRALDIIRKSGYRSVYWTCGGTDSNSASVTGQMIKDSILPKLQNGLVILLHWQGYHTYEVIGEIVDTIRAQGYQFVTLSELMAPTPADGAVLDNGDQSTKAVGTWTASTTYTGKFGGDCLYVNLPGTGTRTFTWTADLPSGTYTVYAWYPSATNRPTNAPYTIYTAAGSTTVRVNQQTNGGQWVNLGSFPFMAGIPAKVVLSDNCGTSGQALVADAIKFVPNSWSSSLTPTWTANIGSPIQSSPTVADGIAYFGADNGSLYAVNVTNGTAGQIRWTRPLGSAIRTRPMVYNNVVYVTTSAGSVAAVDTTDGHVIWQVPVGTGELTSPAPFQDSVFVGSADGHLYRVALTNGQIKATSDALGGAVTSMPAVRNTDLVWVGAGDGSLRCLTSDLATVRWTMRAGPLPTSAPPFIDWMGNTLVVGSPSEAVLMVNATTGAAACPQYPGRSIEAVEVDGGITGSAWVDPDTNMAYFGTKKGLVYGLELGTGMTPAQWPLRVIGAGAFSSAAMLLKGPTGAKYVYIGSDTGKFFAIPAGMPGRYKLYTDSSTSTRFTSPAVSGLTGSDKVVVGTSDGRLMAFPLL